MEENNEIVSVLGSLARKGLGMLNEHLNGAEGNARVTTPPAIGNQRGSRLPFNFRDTKFVAAVKGSKDFKELEAGADRNQSFDDNVRIVEDLVRKENLRNVKDFRRMGNRLIRSGGTADRRRAQILRLAARRMDGTAGSSNPRGTTGKTSSAKPNSASLDQQITAAVRKFKLNPTIENAERWFRLMKRAGRTPTVKDFATISKGVPGMETRITVRGKSGKASTGKKVKRRTHIFAAAKQRVMGPGRPFKNAGAKKNASVIRTGSGGYQVVHSLTQVPITGVFRGEGAKKRAMDRAQEVIDRNLKTCAVKPGQRKCSPRVVKKNAGKVTVKETIAGFVLTGPGGRKLPAFKPYNTRAQAQKIADKLNAPVNPRKGPTKKSKKRRAQFLDDDVDPKNLPTSTLTIGSLTIPKRGLIFIGNYRQINYSSNKFRNRVWREYKHRPEGVARVGQKLTTMDAGAVFLHPDGHYLLIVPSKNQRRKFRMNGRGLLN